MISFLYWAGLTGLCLFFSCMDNNNNNLQFEWPNMQMCCFRLKLAALHFNEHINHPQATTKQGVRNNMRWCSQSTKKEGILWRLCMVQICYKSLTIIYTTMHTRLHWTTAARDCEALLGMSNQTKKIQSLCVLHLSDRTRQQQYSSTKVDLTFKYNCIFIGY